MKPSGEMKPVARKPAKRTSPVADVDIFSYSAGTRDALSSNFLENTEKLSKYALATYGELGRIIREKAYPVIQRTVLEPYPDISPQRLRKMQAVLDTEWAKDIKKMNELKTKFYGFMLQLLTEEGEERIRNNAAEWEVTERTCDPLRLWLAMERTHGLRTDDMSEAESRRSARTGYSRCHQQSGESLLSYYNRFRQNVNVIRAVGEVEPSEETQAVDFLESLDKRVYGEMLRELKNRVRNNEAVYPNTLTGAHAYAKNYIPPYVRKTDASSNKSVYVTTADTSPTSAVPAAVATESRPAKKMCSECGRFHFGACWGRNREKSPYATPKVVNIHETGDKTINNKKIDLASSDDESRYYVGHFDRQRNKSDIDFDITHVIYKCSMNDDVHESNPMIVYLDSCANAHVMHNIELLHDIRRDDKTAIRVKGVGGESILRKSGKFPCFGNVHVLGPENKVNILSLGKVEDLYPVEFIEGDFRVHIDENNMLLFRRMENDLWGCDFSDILPVLRELDKEQYKEVMMIDTVLEREKRFSTSEVRRAKQAREIMRQLGYPSARDMIKMIVKGMMINIPVTVQDVLRAEKIYGPDVASLKGKTVKHKTHSRPQVYVPRAMMKKQDMYSDIFYWRGVGFMLSVVMPLRMRFITALTKPESKSYLKTILEDHVGRMKDHGFDVRTVYVDPQRALAKLSGTLGVVIDITGTRRHVRVIERTIRTMKERMRATECGLPFKCALRFVKGLAYFVISRLNMFPSSDQRDGVSPRELYTGIKPDYDREVRELSFGDYIQAHEDFDTNTNLPRERTRGCIALFPKGNAAGSWKMYSLKTDAEINRDHWTSLPMPDVVIDRLNALYEADEKINSEILQPYTENKNTVNIDVKKNRQVGDLVEPKVLNEEPQFDQDGVDDEENQQGFDYGHEEEPIPRISKKNRAIEAIRNIFSPVASGSMNEEDTFIPDDEHEKLVPETLGSVEIDGVRKSGRLINRRYVNVMQKVRHVRTVNRDSRERFVFSLTRHQAYKKYATDAEKAAIAEMTQIYNRGTLRIMDKKLMTLPQLRRLIRSALIFDDKYDMNGVFERLKARLVARGNEMDETLYEDRSSPTISTIHVMIMLAIAAKERRKIRVLDIGNAFLEASMKSGEDVYVELDPVTSRILTMIDDSIVPMLGEDGKLVAKLDKALYGCIQSAKLWFDKLTEVLTGYGFEVNPCDECVMNKVVSGKQITVGFHVDDLLITCEDDRTIDNLVLHLRASFREVKEKKDDIMGYLGMRISINDAGVYVDMNAYTAKVVEEFGTGGFAPTPAMEDLFNDRDVPLLSEIDRKRFHSIVAKLLYLAKRTRPDILLAISHLASRVTIANQDDSPKLNRVLRYLNGHKKMSLHFRRDSDMTLRAYIDASFAIHSNGTSRTGMIIELGGATVCAWTSKQKMTTKSACESELVGLSDGSSEVLGCREFLQYQGYHMGPAVIYQDNTSVLDLIKAGHPTSHRTRHLKARYFFTKDYIDAEEIVLKHMGTEWMLADYLTKPLCGEKFQRFLKIIIGLVSTPE